MGPAIGEVARRLGRELMPWQQDLVDVAFKYDPVTSLLRYTEIDLTVPRQSGKTLLIFAKKVFRLIVLARKYGPQTSTYTAQSRQKARKKLEREWAELLRASPSFREVAHAKARPSKPTEWRLSLNNGSEAIQFGSGSYLQIDAPSRTGGHGDTLDDGTIDEAWAQEDDTVEAGMRPAMATRMNAQLWVISTAGDATSKYLWRKIVAGRAASLSGQHGSVCFADYSAADDADPGDPATWWSCMPALGHTVTEAFVASEWERAQRKGQEGIDSFRRAYLNQWPEIPILEDKPESVIDSKAWADAAKADASELSPIALAVDVTPNRAFASIGLAGRRPDGRVQVEVIDNRPGTAWVVPRLVDLIARRDPCALLLDKTSPAASLLPALAEAGVEPYVTTATDMAQAFGGFYDAATQDGLRHTGDPLLAQALAAARTRDLAGGRAWTRHGAADISPLVTVTLAHFGLVKFGMSTPPPPPQGVPVTAVPAYTAGLAAAGF